MTAPEARSGGLDTNARGLMVLVVALIVGLALLYTWGPGDTAESGSKGSGTTPTVPLDGLGTTTTVVTTTTEGTGGSDRAPSEVSVMVLNGGGPTGAAVAGSGTIGEAGFTMLDAGNSPVQVDATTIYYADDYQEDAIEVASILGKGTDAVKPLTEASLGGTEGAADVVVILGPDTPPVSGTTTTTTA